MENYMEEDNISINTVRQGDEKLASGTRILPV